MTTVKSLKQNLQPGHVYRRADLEQWSTAVDRHLQVLQKDGTLKKVAAGIYYYPTQSVFGAVPPSDEALVACYLKDDRFLLTSPNDYNKLGVGTTQLYNKVVVYNHKRHGDVKLGNRVFSFCRQHFFPPEVTPEFLLVDLVNNIEQVAEDKEEVLARVKAKVADLDIAPLAQAVEAYGSMKTRKFFSPLIATV